MIAGGTGLAPLRAVIEQIDQEWQRSGSGPRVHLLHGVRMPWHLDDRPHMRELAESRPWFEYTEVVSDDASYPGTRGKVGTVAARQALHGRKAMVCGGPEMVGHTLRELTSAGMHPEHITYEHFYYAAADQQTASAPSDQVRRHEMTNSNALGRSSRYQTPASIRAASFDRGDSGPRPRPGLRVSRPRGRPGEGHGERSPGHPGRAQRAQRAQAEIYDYEHVGDRVSDQVVQMFSQAQLVAEEMAEDVGRDARERVEQARAREREIVQDALNTAGEQVRSYARAAQTQMQTIMETFAKDVDRLGITPLSDDAASPPSRTNGESIAGASDWQVRFQNGTRPDSQGTV